MSALRILVTGSRDWTDTASVVRAFTEAVLRHYPDGVPKPFDWSTVELRHGCARGLDSTAARIAAKWGMQVKGIPADWDMHGRAAGSIRNGQLVAMSPLADELLTFALPHSVGTFDCARKARAAGIVVYDYGLSTSSNTRSTKRVKITGR
jgi:hypothetical protein